MSADSEIPAPSSSAVAAARFDRNGTMAYNLALRLTGSPGAAWYATINAFAAVTERVPADAAAGIDDQDLVLMACWHGRQLLAQVAADPGYAEQLRAHDAAQRAGQPRDPAVAGANAALPIDQRELLAMNGLSGLDHAALAGLLQVDPGLLAVMVGESRLLLHDLLHGSALAGQVDGPDDRQAIAFAALAQDGQLGGADAQGTLDGWTAATPEHEQAAVALRAAGDAYRAWPLAAAPAGLREAAVAAAAATTAAPLLGVAPPAAVESMPAGEHDRPVAPSAAEDVGAADPGATVEWSASDIAALGLEGAPVRAGVAPSPVGEADEPAHAWADAEADDYDDEVEYDDDRGRTPRWHIALVGVLLVAVIVVLVMIFTSKDDPTTPAPPTPTQTTTTRSAAPSEPATIAATVVLRIGGA